MFVGFNRKGFEPALPDVTAAVVVTMVSPHVRGQEPLHPTTEIAIFARPKDEMKVIVHQYVAEQAHRQPLVGIGQKLLEGGEIAILMKDIGPTVTPIEHVVTETADRSTSSSWHGSRLLQTTQSVNK